MTDAGEMWDRRFSEHPWPSEPDPFLVEFASALPAGRGLDLGSGPGRNSLWLAVRGWGFTLVDTSRVALTQAEERAEKAGVRVEVVLDDVLGWRSSEPSYDLVIVANLHPKPESLAQVLASAADALHAGGHLFVVGHDLANLGHHGPPDPERLFTIEGLATALPPTVFVEVLERRTRQPDHTAGPDADVLDVAVLAWATKRVP